MNKKMRVGTRNSQLAMCQTNWVISEINEYFPDLDMEAVTFCTCGDRDCTRPLQEIGGKGLFTEELEKALLDGEIEFAVHSLKDLPTEIFSGLEVGAIPRRATPLDAVVTADPDITSLEELPAGTIVGTSSLRRASQLRLHRPDLIIRNIRGNLDTRLRKLGEGRVDALVLAAAGLERLGLNDRPHFLLPPEVCLPAPGQGALAVEIRCGDSLLKDVCQAALEDRETRLTVAAERAFLQGLGGGCQIPVGALAAIRERELHLSGIVVATDGSRYVRNETTGGLTIDEAQQTGLALARVLIDQGAKEILASGC